MNTFQLVVSTPDGNAFEGQCEELIVRGTEGELAVMAGHIPFVTGLVKSKCTIVLPEGEERVAFVEGGLLTVARESVTLIAGSFEFAE
ncbi:MAG: F0F1 ATP synthase subunit epsilon [Clostridia bacterium]|nr:F0F1 ATP synthase subunit epsilon [Clostridia bacterium]